MAKRRIFKIHPYRKYIILTLFVFLFFGMGYSLLSTDLNVFGGVQLKKYDHTLYGVFEKEKSKSSLVQEYTGSHQDSFTQTGNQKIYYWYGSNDANATTILDKWNVLFGGFCWQMIRTTDTGGVKLLYNGVPSDGKCNNTGTDQQIGTSRFNSGTGSPAYVGYMYNTVYSSQIILMTEYVISRSSLNTNYWYANSVTWGTPTADRYNLNNPYQVSSIDDYPNLVGKYTFNSFNQTYTSRNVQYIVAVDNTSYYYIQLGDESDSTHDLSYYNDTYTYGNSFTDNGDGTYTINYPTTVNRSDWYLNYSNIGTNKYVCKNAINDTCSDLWYVTTISNYSMNYIKVANNYKYSKGFTWDGNKYVLDDDTSVTFWNLSDNINKTSINNAHYTCWNESGECTTISYVYYISGAIPYFINITGGKSVEDAINEMLYNDDVNQRNSIIKTYIDSWYQENMVGYTSSLEDTIFCNDRSQSNAVVNGWNPDGGSITQTISFNHDSLICSNEVDQFSLSNNKAKLTYPVGLASDREMNLLNNSLLRKTGQHYWLISTNSFDANVANGIIINYYSNNTGNATTTNNHGVRPVVSLKPGTQYVSGDGSKNNPYVVEADPVAPSNQHTLTIHYIVRDMDGDYEYAPDYVGTYAEGEEYYVGNPSDDGYYTSDPDVEGIMGDHDLEFTIYYEPFTPTFYSVMIDYYYVGQDTPFDSYSDGFYLYGDYYSITSPTVDGYCPSIDVVEGTIEDDVLVDVYYSPCG